MTRSNLTAALVLSLLAASGASSAQAQGFAPVQPLAAVTSRSGEGMCMATWSPRR
jgi:hypothetical protein